MKRILFTLFFLYMCIPVRLVSYVFCAFQEWLCFEGAFWKTLLQWLKDEVIAWFHPFKFSKGV